MASQGPLLAGAGADDAGVGTVVWNTVANITAADDARATANPFSSAAVSHYLKSSSHGFTIPSGATIDGVVVEIERSRSAAGANVADSRVRIIKGGSIGATDKASATVWPTTDAIATYGSASDLWGETWTDSDINASTFGLAVAAVHGGTGTVSNARVDYIRITVHYTEAGGATVTGSGAIAGAGSVATSGTRKTLGSGAVTGSGVVAASGTRKVLGAGAVAGAGTIFATGSRVATGSGAIAGSGSIAATGTRSVLGVGGVSGSGTVAAQGLRSVIGVGAVPGAGIVAANGVRSTTGTGAIAGVGTISASGVLAGLNWPPSTDDRWDADTDDRWLVTAESNW